MRWIVWHSHYLRFYLYVGNRRKRTATCHCGPSLDTPWRPSDLEQRNGRAVQKGNLSPRNLRITKLMWLSMPWNVPWIATSSTCYTTSSFSSINSRQTRLASHHRWGFDGWGQRHELLRIRSSAFRQYQPLEKARLDKKITTLESERRNFLRERDAATGKLAEIDSSVSLPYTD